MSFIRCKNHMYTKNLSPFLPSQKTTRQQNKKIPQLLEKLWLDDHFPSSVKKKRRSKLRFRTWYPNIWRRSLKKRICPDTVSTAGDSLSSSSPRSEIDPASPPSLSLSTLHPPGFSWSLQSKKSNDPSARGASSRCYAAGCLCLGWRWKKRDKEERGGRMDRTQGRQDRLARTQSGGFECLVNMYSVIDVSPPDDYPSWCVRGGDPWTRDAYVCVQVFHVCVEYGEGRRG